MLIALLRASSIPARYQFGTVDLPAQQAMNWVGGVHTAQGALDLMYQGGLAARGLVSGGRITTVRMEHVWVNAYVNWSPARGSKNATETQHPNPNPNAQLNAWVPMDASYKQYIYTPGMDLQSAVPLDANAFLAAVQQGANLTPAYVQNLNLANLQTQLAGYQNQIKAYIASTPTGANSTVADVLGGRAIQAQSRAMLAGTLPYAVVTKGQEGGQIPDALRWKVKLQGYALDGFGGQGAPLMQQTKVDPSVKAFRQEV